jgi:hypothetical protein
MSKQPSPRSLGQLLLSLCALALPAHAQQMYKCGNTYSQTPCSPEAKVTRLFQGDSPAKASKLQGYELCAAAAPGKTSSPEPESARVQPLGQRVSEVIQFSGQALSAHRYDLSVDSKTKFGVYSGPVAYSCWVSEDQARILRFSGLRSK